MESIILASTVTMKAHCRMLASYVCRMVQKENLELENQIFAELATEEEKQKIKSILISFVSK